MPERTREIAELLIAGLGGAGVTGFWGWLQRKTSNAAENKTGEAAILGAAARIQEIMNEAAKAHMADLRSEVSDLRGRVDQLEGENRQLRQHSESLEAVLRRQGIDIPMATAPGALLVVEDGEARVMRHERKPRKP